MTMGTSQTPSDFTLAARDPACRSVLRGLEHAAAVIGAGLGATTSAALAQRPVPVAPTGFVSGRVVDDSARAVGGAEVVLLALTRRALTGTDGQFRLDRVPLGDWAILVRAIGFRPDTQVVRVTALGTHFVAVTLHLVPVVLPELETTGKLPSPAFGLGFATTLEEKKYCGKCDLNERLLAFGASMTEDGLYLVPVLLSERDTLPWISYYEWPLDSVTPGPWGHGVICARNRSSRPVATRVDSDRTARLLYSDGTVWMQGLRKPAWQDCLRSALLFRDQVPLGAAGVADGWIIAMQGRARPAVLVGVNDFGTPIWTLPLATALATDGPVRNVILAPARGGVTVALAQAPFTWALVDSSGSVTLRSSPLAGGRTDSLLQRAAADRWKAYAVLPVKNGFVQTVESPGVVDGVFVLYDILGRPVKVLPRSGASVLVASAPEMRMLLGYRYNSPRGGRSRLYMYRY